VAGKAAAGCLAVNEELLGKILDTYGFGLIGYVRPNSLAGKRAV